MDINVQKILAGKKDLVIRNKLQYLAENHTATNTIEYRNYIRSLTPEQVLEHSKYIYSESKSSSDFMLAVLQSNDFSVSQLKTQREGLNSFLSKFNTVRNADKDHIKSLNECISYIDNKIILMESTDYIREELKLQQQLSFLPGILLESTIENDLDQIIQNINYKPEIITMIDEIIHDIKSYKKGEAEKNFATILNKTTTLISTINVVISEDSVASVLSIPVLLVDKMIQGKINKKYVSSMTYVIDYHIDKISDQKNKLNTDNPMIKDTMEAYLLVLNDCKVKLNNYGQMVVKEGLGGFYIRNIRLITSNMLKNAKKTGNFEGLRENLLKMVKSCKSPDEVKYLRSDSYHAVKFLEKLAKNKPEMAKQCHDHIEWINTDYREALNKKADELKGKGSTVKENIGDMSPIVGCPEENIDFLSQFSGITDDLDDDYEDGEDYGDDDLKSEEDGYDTDELDNEDFLDEMENDFATSFIDFVLTDHSDDESLTEAFTDLLAKTNTHYEVALYQLWKILDDIDTMSDMAKSNDKLYRAKVEQYQRKRFLVLNDEQVDYLYDNYYKDKAAQLKEGVETVLETGAITKAARKVAVKAEDVSRKVAHGIRKTQDNAKHVGVVTKRIPQHIDNLVNNTIDSIKKMDKEERRKKIVEGSLKVKLFKIIRNGIIFGAAWQVSAALAAIGLLVGVTVDKHLDDKARREILNELETELKICEEKIEDARGDSDKQKKYQLIRIKNKLETDISRVKYRL